jgi:hypothetical protein
MKLIVEEINSISFLTEESNGKKDYYVEGVFLEAETENRNKRIYPRHILEREVARYTAESIAKNRAFGELGHPENPQINLDRVSHIIKSLRQEGNQFIGKAKILDTPFGKIVKNFIDEGAQLGMSTRGIGSIKQMRESAIVQDDYHLATAGDIVADPSCTSAFVRGIMEGKEWIYDNGIFKESELTEIKDIVEDSYSVKKSELSEQLRLEAFNKFMEKLTKI